MDKVLSDNGELLRTGFTTGACATAAATYALKASLEASPDFNWSSIAVKAPDGGTLPAIEVKLIEKSAKRAKALVIKDAGDDYDVTDGLEIYAEVTLTSAAGEIVIEGGDGVGRVTKPGLQLPVGAYAINPKPLQMLRDNLAPLLPDNCGLKVIISAPKGVLLAEKTFNPKLGILGGISIIGTTGIVRPMSEDAFKQSIYVELKQKATLGIQTLILVPGKHGENFAVDHLHYDQNHIVHMSNFVGFCAASSEKLGFQNLVFVGHIGKLVKVAAGIFNTHSKVADARWEIVVAHLALMGAPMSQLNAIKNANTTDEMSELLWQTPYQRVFESLADAAAARIKEHLGGGASVDVVLYDMKQRLLADTRSRTLPSS
jgi:cobalt-precorrin-5B (C1)-methyltransferase